MSVTTARLSDGDRWLIGGAPRSLNVGQVMMFRQGPRLSGYLNLNQAHTLTGQQFGSGFGYSIAVADFNLDKSVLGLVVYWVTGHKSRVKVHRMTFVPVAYSGI